MVERIIDDCSFGVQSNKQGSENLRSDNSFNPYRGCAGKVIAEEMEESAGEQSLDADSSSRELLQSAAPITKIELVSILMSAPYGMSMFKDG